MTHRLGNVVGLGEKRRCLVEVSSFGMQPGQPVQGEHLDFPLAVAARSGEHLVQAVRRLRQPPVGVQRGERVVGQHGPFTPAGGIEPLARRNEDQPGVSVFADRAQHPTKVSAGVRGGPRIADRLGGGDGLVQSRPGGSEVTGLLVDATEVGQMMSGRRTEAEVSRRFRRPLQMVDGIGEALLGLGEAAQEGLGMTQSPVVTERPDQLQRLLAGHLAVGQGAEGDMSPGRQQPAGPFLPVPAQPVELGLASR